MRYKRVFMLLLGLSYQTCSEETHFYVRNGGTVPLSASHPFLSGQLTVHALSPHFVRQTRFPRNP